MNPAEKILRTLDHHLTSPAEIRLLGGAALILGYGLNRSTEDADLLMDDKEFEFLGSATNFGTALEATNRELEPLGLYLTHIWGPEQQILTEEWRVSCRRLSFNWASNLKVSVLGPIDLILSKLCRADEGDMYDIRFLLETESLKKPTVENALKNAVVPEIFNQIFPRSCEKLQQLLDKLD